ncbi:MAG TPA: hypothetical protein VEC57_04105 [Candidatus Limnocylindrales bacterium]|nr:hypothetical protein [Candidatus Limnocylindrales bacterium]
MARSSVSEKTQHGATVFDFLPFLVRRQLGWRVGTRGEILARASAGVITVVHRAPDACGCDVVDQRIAQLRPQGDRYQLFWKKGNGRWTAYCHAGGDTFCGSIADCLSEISRDPFGCYWS